MAIFKSAKRSIETKYKTCDCGKYENYYKGRSPFFCNEDKIVEKADLIKTIEKIISKSKFSEKFKAEKFFSYLKKIQKSFISVSEVDSNLRDEFKEFYEQNEDLKSKKILALSFQSMLLVCYLGHALEVIVVVVLIILASDCIAILPAMYKIKLLQIVNQDGIVLVDVFLNLVNIDRLI